MSEPNIQLMERLFPSPRRHMVAAAAGGGGNTGGSNKVEKDEGHSKIEIVGNF